MHVCAQFDTPDIVLYFLCVVTTCRIKQIGVFLIQANAQALSFDASNENGPVPTLGCYALSFGFAQRGDLKYSAWSTLKINQVGKYA